MLAKLLGSVISSESLFPPSRLHVTMSRFAPVPNGSPPPQPAAMPEPRLFERDETPAEVLTLLATRFLCAGSHRFSQSSHHPIVSSSESGSSSLGPVMGGLARLSSHSQDAPCISVGARKAWQDVRAQGCIHIITPVTRAVPRLAGPSARAER